MKRLIEIVLVLIDRSFWCEFIECDMREEAQMMHEHWSAFQARYS